MVTTTYRVIDIITMSTDYLAKKGIENPRLNAELILGHTLNMNRVHLYLNFERPVSKPELEQIRTLLKRRANHEPIQYILAETEFYGLKFKLNRFTLIPRPETELLVDTVIKACQRQKTQQQKIHILDIGTGSGNIAIALAKNVESASITAIDIQPRALEIAAVNSQHNQVDEKIMFLQKDIFAENIEFAGDFDIIVSNPPYISQDEFKKLPDEIKKWEPYVALNGGVDGLEFYHRIIELAKKWLAADGIIALEIGAFQANEVKNIFSAGGLFHKVDIMNDLNQLPRVLFAVK